MSKSPFCDACGARWEWHLTTAGKNMPIDPEPHSEGRFMFGPGLRLVTGAPGTRPKMYRSHWDTCAKKGQAPRRAAFVCDRAGCEGEGRHLHCYRCGSVDHFANECESGGL